MSVRVDKNVFWLKISVDNVMSVDVLDGKKLSD